MKSILQRLLQFELKWLAKLVLAKYKPRIVGVTGSVGKTTTKEAIDQVLRSQFNTRKSIKNYNNELGLPLTILGCHTGGRSFIQWLKVFFHGWKLILFPHKDYPQVLVLEMAVDRPGDMKYLQSIVQLQVGVITTIGPTHLEFFESVDQIQQEKARLVKNISCEGYAILNLDNKKTASMASEVKAPVYTYGFNSEADVYAQNVEINFSGLKFDLVTPEGQTSLQLKKVISFGAVYSILAATAVGLSYQLSLEEIKEAVEGFSTPPGRMRLFEGEEDSFIVDDTYNAAPQSTLPALETIQQLAESDASPHRLIVVLGDMLELGSYTEQGHYEVGEKIAQIDVDFLLTIGQKTPAINKGARKAGLPSDRMRHFDSHQEIINFLQSFLRKGDIVLIKGSQGARMEKVVKPLLSHPQEDVDLLVRQGPLWQ